MTFLEAALSKYGPRVMDIMAVAVSAPSSSADALGAPLGCATCILEYPVEPGKQKKKKCYSQFKSTYYYEKPFIYIYETEQSENK